MRIVGCRINNYKSIGNDRNYLFTEKGVTALIGKNESGKSNVLEAIGNLSFLKPMSTAYSKNKNRNRYGEISISVDLEFSEDELEKFKINQSMTKFNFSDNLNINFEGGLSELIKSDNALMSSLNYILDYYSQITIWGTEANKQKAVREYLNELKNIEHLIYINYKIKLNNLISWIVGNFPEKDELINIIKAVINSLDKYYDLMPQMYYRNEDKQLKSNYKYDEIKNIIANDKNNIFYSLLDAAKIDEAEILEAFDSEKIGEKSTTRNKIISKIKSHIIDEFNKFYDQEEIDIQIEYENRTFAILVRTGDNAMDLSERSNGLRWYLSIFIDILSQNYRKSTVVYLLDEPGVYLHVNAQKELLTLFSKLAQSGNQVIYTTHSPYMIDSNNILNIRAIEKDENGNTRIFKNAYNQELSRYSKMETLSPLINALGADLKFNFGPYDKLNIITEGISDYMYLKAMLNCFSVTNPPNIIPSSGVSNINKIISILIGWGCDFQIVMDYDMAAYREYKVLTEKLDQTLSEKVVFINCSNIVNKKEMFDDPKTIEDLIMEADFEKLNNPYDRTDSTKVIASKEFYDKVVRNEIDLNEETIINFKKLFSILDIKI